MPEPDPYGTQHAAAEQRRAIGIRKAGSSLVMPSWARRMAHDEDFWDCVRRGLMMRM